MDIIKCKNYDEVSLKSAEIIAEQIAKKGNSVMGFATGSTPLGAYRELIKAYTEGKISFAGITSFNLDEYCGLRKDSPQSYYYYMMQNLFSHVNINKNNINMPDGTAEDFQKECNDYEEKIQKAGGIDFQILGVGANGHIGFNEPDEMFFDKTRVVALHDSTIQANARFFNDATEVPKTAISMGVGTIMRAEKILLMASGKDKKYAVRQLIYGDANPRFPVTILKFHKNVIVVADREVLD